MAGILRKIFSVRPTADDRVLKVLGETRLFENLSLVDLENLAERVESREYDPGQIIFRQGEKGDGLYIIDEGAVEIVISADVGGAETTLASFHDREAFGEMALIDDAGLRTATARAAGRTRCLRLAREDFDRLLASSHATAAKILYHLCRILSRRLARTSRAAAVKAAPPSGVGPPPPPPRPG